MPRTKNEGWLRSQGGGLKFGQLSAPDCEPVYTCALQSTMTMYKLNATETQFVDEKSQDMILGTLYTPECPTLDAQVPREPRIQQSRAAC
jgi:hypothetical protein